MRNKLSGLRDHLFAQQEAVHETGEENLQRKVPKIITVRQELGRFEERRSARFCAARRQTVRDIRQALAEIGKWLCVNDVQLTRIRLSAELKAHSADCKEGPLFSALFEFAKRGGGGGVEA